MRYLDAEQFKQRNDLIIKLLKQDLSPTIIAIRAGVSTQTVHTVKKKNAEEFGFILRVNRVRK